MLCSVLVVLSLKVYYGIGMNQMNIQSAINVIEHHRLWLACMWRWPVLRR